MTHSRALRHQPGVTCIRFVDKQGEWVPVLASAAAALEDAYSREIWTHTQNSTDPVRVHITGSEQVGVPRPRSERGRP
jgi:hypothetical protein